MYISPRLGQVENARRHEKLTLSPGPLFGPLHWRDEENVFGSLRGEGIESLENDYRSRLAAARFRTGCPIGEPSFWVSLPVNLRVVFICYESLILLHLRCRFTITRYQSRRFIPEAKEYRAEFDFTSAKEKRTVRRFL